MSAFPGRFTPEEYLQLERTSVDRSEFIDGYIYAMSGGTLEHDKIVHNVDHTLHPQLVHGSCETRSSSFRIATSRRGPHLYPDLSVICGEPELLDDSRDSALNPTLVFEVFSKSTQKYDRETKVALYREIPTLRHIVLISQYAISVEHHLRTPTGKWKLEKLTDRAATLHLPAIEATLPLAKVYNKLLLHSTT